MYLTEGGISIDDTTSQQASTPTTEVAPQPNSPAATNAVKSVSVEEVSPVLESISTYSAKVAPTHAIYVPEDFNDTDYHVFNGDYNSYYIHDNLNTTDKYVQCAECGKYSPIGEVTKKLDDNLICNGHNDSCGSYIEDDYFALTYEEILYVLDHDGYLPESAYTRSAEHMGITRSYDDYINHIYNPEPIHLGGVSEGIAIPYVIGDVSNSANEDVNLESEPVNEVDTVNYY